MAKFMNIVRCKVKSSNKDEYLKKLDIVGNPLRSLMISNLMATPSNL